jgi:uncharacterized membrane protein SpoIIM required for sporulation
VRTTGIYLFDPGSDRRSLGDAAIFLHAAAGTVVGICAGFVLFPAEASLIGVFLVALAQHRTVEALLDRNRDEIWGGQRRPRDANFRLARSLMVFFLGVLVTYSAATLVAPASRLLILFGRQAGDFGGASITAIVFDDPATTLGHNLLVMLACFLFSLLYRHGGMLLVLAWNASVWGVVFPFIARTAPDRSAGGTAIYFIKSFVSIFPHLLLEAAGYVLVAMAGVFLSKALQKYPPGSREFGQVAGAVGKLTALAAAFLTAAALLEAYLAPALIGGLFG